MKFKFLKSYKMFNEATEAESQSSGNGKVSYVYGMVLSTGDKEVSLDNFINDAKDIITKDIYVKNGGKIISKVGDAVKINIERSSKGAVNWNLAFNNTINGFGWDGKSNGKVVFNDVDKNTPFNFKITAPEKLGEIPLAGCLVYDYGTEGNPSAPQNMLVNEITRGGTLKRKFEKAKSNVIEFEAKAPIVYLVYGKIVEYKVIDIANPFEMDSIILTEEGKSNIKAVIEENKANKFNGSYTIKTGASQDGNPDDMIKNEKTKAALGDKEVKRRDWDFYLTLNRYKVAEEYLKSIGVSEIVKDGVPKDANDNANIYGKFDSADLKNSINRKLTIKPNKK